MKREYSIELVDKSQDGVGRVLATETDLDAANVLYRFWMAQFPDRIVILYDRARVIARSDCP